MPLFEGFTSLPAANEFTLDQAFEWHRIHSSEVPAFVYPGDNGEQTYVSWKQLGDAIDVGAQYIKSHILGILNKEPSSEPLVVALLAAADPLTFVTFVLSTLRLTHLRNIRPILPLLISPRNSPAAIAHLLKLKQAKHLFVMHGPTQLLSDDTLKHLEPDETPSTFFFPKFEDLYRTNIPLGEGNEENFNSTLEPASLDKPAIILHSSGSTAYPKPITMTHEMLMEWCIKSIDGNSLQGEVLCGQAPTFTAIGLFIAGWAVYQGFIRSVPNPSSNRVASDPESFLEELVQSGVTICFTVPSFIEAWANDSPSIRVLKKLKMIMWGGGPMNNKIGQYLISLGVNLVMVYGATETGPASYIPEKTHPEGHDWFRVYPSSEAELIPYPGEANTFELVFRTAKGHHLAVINMHVDGIPAYATNDLVERHPNDPTLIRMKGRADDRIMHSTGENTNPGPIEQRISKIPHVKGAVVFGRAKFSTGVVIEPVSWDMAERLGLEKFRNLIWPSVEEANEYAPAHSRIFKEMIILASPSKPFTWTAKNTVRRGAVIKDYEREIEDLYKAVEGSIQTDLSLPDLDEHGNWSSGDTHRFVTKVVRSILKHIPDMNDDDDIFVYGCSSLQATYIRNTILHALRQTASSSRVKDVPNNFVYQHPTINALTDGILQIFLGRPAVGEKGETVRQQRLQALIKKYTQDWPEHQPQSTQEPDSEVILLTGSTGGFGSQVLVELVAMPSVSRIYAFNRASKIPLRDRHAEAFMKNRHDLSFLDSEKIVFVEGDTTVKKLGINDELFNEIRDTVTVIVHTAWRVDLNIPLVSFEPAIRGLRYLIDFALASPHKAPPRLMFTSSIANVKLWADEPAIPEAPFTNMNSLSPTPYNESKWICERILESALLETHLKPIIVRVGQLAGGMNGQWNAREWFPAIVKASQILKAAPGAGGLVSFVPLHLAAQILLELRNSPCTYAHIVHPRPIPWSTLITWVAEELQVPTIPSAEWLARLEAAPRTSQTLLHNPALLLLDFYRLAFSGGHGLENREAMGVASFETINTVLNAPTLRPDRLPQLTRDDVCHWIQYWNLY